MTQDNGHRQEGHCSGGLMRSSPRLRRLRAIQQMFPGSACAAVGVTLMLLTPYVLRAEAASTNEPCAVEMQIVQEQDAAFRAHDEERVHKADQAQWKMLDDWRQKQGTTVKDAAELLQYVAQCSGTGVVTRVEVRWSDGNRGVVVEVEDGEKGDGATIWYLFKYAGKWRRLARTGVIYD